MKDTEKLMHISSSNRLIRKKPTEMVSLCPSNYLTKKRTNLSKLLEFIKLSWLIISAKQ